MSYHKSNQTKVYSGEDTAVNGRLIDDLRRTKGTNTLYVSHYYFALNDGKHLIFYYNHQYYWDKVPIKHVKDYVWNNLEIECAVLKNVNIDNCDKPVGYKKIRTSETFPTCMPKIGNYYSCSGSRAITYNSQIVVKDSYFHDDIYFKKSIKDFDINDLNAVLCCDVLTKTPNYIKSFYELKCFTKHLISNSNTIIGAVIGDVIGSVFEWNNIKTKDFNMFNPKCDFTDDTVLTIAVADCILNRTDFANTILKYGERYPGRGYGGSFGSWLRSSDPKPYNSFGNGSAMRVSGVGFAFDDIETVLKVAKQSAEVTHNHPEGIKGAQSTAAAIFLARQGKSKQEIKEFITTNFNYNLDFTLDEIRPTYQYDVTCQGSVPQAIVAFLESTDFENAIRLAISIGGDSDTIACITGGIASAFYKEIPEEIKDFAVEKLPYEFIEIMNKFDKKFNN